ncbi:MAG: hypothetical protein ACXWP5_03250 [Bdellovibrionota bacterium]
MAKKKKVKFGKVDLLPKGNADPKNVKIRISILIEGDLLEAYKEAAKRTSHGEYQTLMKEKLREGLNLRETSQFSEQDLEFLKTRLRPAFIEIVDQEIEERIQPKALKGA